jgi:hypothetical protein
MEELTSDSLETQAREARGQAERARRLARGVANNNIAKDLTVIAEEYEQTAEECERRAREIADDQKLGRSH